LGLRGGGGGSGSGRLCKDGAGGQKGNRENSLQKHGSPLEKAFFYKGI
jgi:hypothetical protein